MKIPPAAFLLALAASAVFAQSEYDKAMKDGDIYYDRQDWEKSLSCYQKAIKAKPESPNAHAVCGSVLARLKRWDDSIKEFNTAISLDKDKSDTTVYAYKELGLTYGQMSKFEESITAFKSGLEIDPKNEALWRNLGVSYAKLRKWKEAIEAWENTLKINPNQPNIRQSLAEAKNYLKADEESRAANSDSSPDKPVTFALPNIGDMISSADDGTLVVSVPSTSELVYYDTVANKEVKRVPVEFKPWRLAVQGENLFATSQGSSVLYVLDFQKGTLIKEIKVPGDPLTDVACHPSKGLVYVSNSSCSVISVNISTGSTVDTKGKGEQVVVDPKSGSFVFTGWTSRKDYDVEVEKDENGKTVWYWDEWGYRSMIRKYAVKSDKLEQVGINNNVAVNGYFLNISPDGDKIAMAGGGGWRPKRGGSGGGYNVAVFSTDDVTTMLGQVQMEAYPKDIAFHPVLNIGAGMRTGTVYLFNPKSFAVFKTIQLSPNDGESTRIGFCGRGEKLVIWCMNGSLPGRLLFIPIELTSEEKTLLDQHFSGKASAQSSAADQQKTIKDAEEAEKAGDTEKAVELYKKAAEADPTSEQGKRAAKKAADLESQSSKQDSKALLKTARDLEERGQSKAALKYYKRIIAEFPQSAEAKEARKKVDVLEKK